MHPDLICGLLLWPLETAKHMLQRQARNIYELVMSSAFPIPVRYDERTCFHSHHVPVQCRLYSADTLLPVGLLFLYGVGVQLTEDALRNTTGTQSR